MTRTANIVQARLPLRDPHDCTDAADELALYQAFYDTLLRREGGGMVPGLAESWSVSEDARRWRLRLRTGVRFHDGTICDAAAAKVSLERMARPDKGYTLGSPAVWRQYLEGARIAADGHDLTVELAAPMADFADVLVQGFIVAPSALETLDAGDTTVHCGTGPYRLAGFAGDCLEAEANRDHYAGAPANSRLRWLSEADAHRRLAMLRGGKVQVATSLEPGSDGGDDITMVRYRAPVAIIYILNAASGPLGDARIRRALNVAVDRPALIDEVMRGHATPLHGFVSPAHFGAGDDSGATHDLQEARRLLAEAGYGDGLVLDVNCPTSLPDEAERLTAALSRQLEDVGITLRVHIHEDREAYAHMVRRKEIHDLCVFDSSPMSTFRVLHEKIDSRVSGAWWQGYRNRDLEALLDLGRRTPDDEARSAIWREVYNLLQADPAWLTLYNPHRELGLAGPHPAFRMPADGVLDVRSLPAMTEQADG